MVAMMMMVWRNLAIALTIAVPEVSSYPGVLLVMMILIKALVVTFTFRFQILRRNG